ncbi:hypothetical protein [Streptomyces vinaceus]|uniref:hypothetical protein n=1 Tax=Streptomyces vinaceus TaxID=1960 RepID=UPI0010532CDC|nr:hypothetical protein [Streptomyces vinaceus]GHE38955.1 hypothetical protein GCM10017778_22960 [Streptomyces vinaceus]
MTPRRVRRGVAVGWIALVLAGAAYTLYLDDSTSAPRGPQHWERAPAPADEPVPCPTQSDGSVAPTASGCTYWRRS